MHRIYIRALAFSLVLGIMAPNIYADNPPNLLNSVEKIDPGKTASEIMEPEFIPEAPGPSMLQVPSKKPQPPTDDATSSVRFYLRDIELIGNTVFSKKQLLPLYQDKLNSEVSLTELEMIARKITEYYRNAGYILTQAIIPPQRIDNDGIVKIKIIEGYVNQISIVGCRSKALECILKKYGAQITKKRPLNIADLERYSFLASDIPGAEVRAVLSRSPDTTGAADLTFMVQEHKLGGSISYNNHNQEIFGRQQLIGSVHVNNLSYASNTAVNGIVSRNANRMQYIAISHRQQVNSYGLGINGSMSHIHTNPDMGDIGLGGLEIPGRSFIANVGLDYAWLRSYKKNFNIGTNFKLLNSTTEFGEQTLFKDNIRSINIYGIYKFLTGLKNNNYLAITYTQGLDIFNAQGNPPSRVGQDLTFSKFDIYASNLHGFSKSKLNSYIALKAQYAFQLLPSSETFAYGGGPFGYGYAPSTFTGDKGIAGLIELRYPTFSNQKFCLSSQAFAFFDFGYVWQNNKAIIPNYQYGFSTGIGARVNMLRHVNADFVVGAPLKSSQITGTPNYIRLLFNLNLYI